MQALDSLFVDFYVSQQSVAALRIGQAAELHVDTYPNRVFSGKITAISPKLDPASRMLSVRALVQNADHALLPGMFATILLQTGAPHRYITLPNAAIVYNPYGSLVYVVDAGKPATVHQVIVRTGPVPRRSGGGDGGPHRGADRGDRGSDQIASGFDRRGQ